MGVLLRQRQGVPLVFQAWEWGREMSKHADVIVDEIFDVFGACANVWDLNEHRGWCATPTTCECECHSVEGSDDE